MQAASRVSLYHCHPQGCPLTSSTDILSVNGTQGMVCRRWKAGTACLLVVSSAPHLPTQGQTPVPGTGVDRQKGGSHRRERRDRARSSTAPCGMEMELAGIQVFL